MSKHIRVAIEAGHVVVTVDDYELFDYVGDFLTEERDIEPEYHVESVVGSRRYFAMHFAEIIALEFVSAAIEELNPDEIERIWRLNNPRQL